MIMNKKEIVKSVIHVEKLDAPFGCGSAISSKFTETLKLVNLPIEEPRLTGIFRVAFMHLNDVYVISCTCLHFYMGQTVGEFVLVTQLSRFTAVITLTGAVMYGESVRMVNYEFCPKVTSVKVTIYNNYDDYVDCKAPINELLFNDMIYCHCTHGSAKDVYRAHNTLVKQISKLNGKKI